MNLPLFVLAVFAALVLGPRGPVYWDSFGYVSQAVTGQVGGLALGRPLFVIVSHGIARAHLAMHGSVWTLEPLLRGFWLGVSATAAPLTHMLARRCGLSGRAAAFAGGMVALSPAMAHTGAAVLTDGPSVAMSLLAFVWGAHAAGFTGDGIEPDPRPNATFSWRYGVASGAALGAAFGLREQAIAQGLVLALLCAAAPRGRRLALAATMLAGFAIVAAAPVLFVYITQRRYLQLIVGWLHAMRRERSAHPYAWSDLRAYAAWVLALGPCAVAAAIASWTSDWRSLVERRTVLFAVAAPALLQLLLLGGYQDISYSPRYLLPALAGALAIPGAIALDRWIGLSRTRLALAGAALVLPVIVGGPLVHARERAFRTIVDGLPRELANVPHDAVIVSGQACPAIEMVRRLARTDPQSWSGRRPEWQTVCPGWGWPADIDARLDRATSEGRILVLDLRAGAWLGPRQQSARWQVERYVAQRTVAVGGGGVVVWR